MLHLITYLQKLKHLKNQYLTQLHPSFLNKQSLEKQKTNLFLNLSDYKKQVHFFLKVSDLLRVVFWKKQGMN